MVCYDVKHVIQKSAVLDKFLIAKYGRIIKGQKNRERVFCGFELSATNEILGFGCFEEAQMWCDLKGLKLETSHYDVIKPYDSSTAKERKYSWQSDYVPVSYDQVAVDAKPEAAVEPVIEELTTLCEKEDIELEPNPIEEDLVELEANLTDTPSLEDAEFAEFLAMAEKL